MGRNGSARLGRAGGLREEVAFELSIGKWVTDQSGYTKLRKDDISAAGRLQLGLGNSEQLSSPLFRQIRTQYTSWKGVCRPDYLLPHLEVGIC